MDKDVPRINWTEEKYEHLLAIEERKKKDLLFRLDVALVKKKQLKRQVEKLTFIARTSIATEKLKSICEPIDYGYKYDGPTGARPAPVIWHKSYGVDAYGSRYAPDKTQRAEDEEPSLHLRGLESRLTGREEEPGLLQVLLDIGERLHDCVANT